MSFFSFLLKQNQISCLTRDKTNSSSNSNWIQDKELRLQLLCKLRSQWIHEICSHQSRLNQTNTTNMPCSSRNLKKNDLLLIYVQFWLFFQSIWNELQDSSCRFRFSLVEIVLKSQTEVDSNPASLVKARELLNQRSKNATAECINYQWSDNKIGSNNMRPWPPIPLLGKASRHGSLWILCTCATKFKQYWRNCKPLPC